MSQHAVPYEAETTAGNAGRWLSRELDAIAGPRAPRINRDVPLGSCGLDSLETLELAARIEDQFGFALLDSDNVHTLSLTTLVGELTRNATPAPADSAVNRSAPGFLTDASLPDDIRPQTSRAPSRPRHLLLTGGTGFLGAYLLRDLLRSTEARVSCLVRGGSGPGSARLLEGLRKRGLLEPSFEGRIKVIDGDLAQPYLGLSRHRFSQLAADIDAIYHLGATVNWCYPYEALRQVHVRGTLDLLRLACLGRPKSFHFVSTLAVCYPTKPVARIDAATDPLTFAGDLDLGYARAKAVAESLVRRAGLRGLDVTIIRPPLVAGDSRTGIGNSGDLLSTLLAGCIRMGAAPDLDWVLDCCAVDDVSRSIVAFVADRSNPRSDFLHLANPVTRHWRECVLWMNLYGYRIRLLPYGEWLRLAEADSDRHSLRPLLPFLTQRVGRSDSTYLPEVFSRERRDRVDFSATVGTRTLTPLDPLLLERYFDHFVADGFFPVPAQRMPSRVSSGPLEWGTVLVGDARSLSNAVPESLGHTRTGDANSLIGELASWRHGSDIGVHRWHVRLDGIEVDLAVKIKPEGDFAAEVGRQIATASGSRLGTEFERHKEVTGLVGGCRREVGIARQTDASIRSHMPHYYAARLGAGSDPTILITEYLDGMRLMDTVNEPGRWRKHDIETAMRGAARLHAVWYGREHELRNQTWLGPLNDCKTMTAATGLWRALAAEAPNLWHEALGSDSGTLRQNLIREIPVWWSTYESLPQTLVHNDFNLRNVALRPTQTGHRLCAFDWELATVAPPQRDIAEFLCFVLPPDAAREDVEHFLGVHRRHLERRVGSSMSAELSTLAFRLALYDLMVNRLALYGCIHRFCELRFLPRVLRTWKRLYKLFPLP